MSDKRLDGLGSSATRSGASDAHVPADPRPAEFNAGDTVDGPLTVTGRVFCGSSELYFSDPDHASSGVANTAGWAGIENAQDLDALSISGRVRNSGRRQVRLSDDLEITGGLAVGAGLSIGGDASVDGSIALGVSRGIADFNAPLSSGLYCGANAAGTVPDRSHDFAHLLAVRHGDLSTHRQLQIASSYAENDKLYFRKIARPDMSNATSGWHELATAARIPKFQTGSEVALHSSLETADGDRTELRPVRFSDGGFSSPPQVFVALSLLDCANDRNTRIFVHAVDIRADGFTLSFNSWANTTIYYVQAVWLAIGY